MCSSSMQACASLLPIYVRMGGVAGYVGGKAEQKYMTVVPCKSYTARSRGPGIFESLIEATDPPVRAQANIGDIVEKKSFVSSRTTDAGCRDIERFCFRTGCRC